MDDSMSNESDFGGAFDAALGGAVTSGGEQALKAGAAFLDSAIGKILITLVAGVITGGAGAAIVGPVLAALGPTLPAMLIGETTFLSDWVNDLTAYTNSPLVLQVPGLSEAIGADTAKAMQYIQQVKIGPKQKEIDKRIMDHDFQGGFLATPDEFAAWYRTMMLEVIGPDAKYGGTPEELAEKLKIRQDAAAMAISVWNGTKLPDMKKYDPYTGLPKNVTYNSPSLSKGTVAAVKADIKTKSASSAINPNVAKTIAASVAPPQPINSQAAAPDTHAMPEEVRKAAPFIGAGLGVGGALLLGAAMPIVGVAGLAVGGLGYLLSKR